MRAKFALNYATSEGFFYFRGSVYCVCVFSDKRQEFCLCPIEFVTKSYMCGFNVVIWLCFCLAPKAFVREFVFTEVYHSVSVFVVYAIVLFYCVAIVVGLVLAGVTWVTELALGCHWGLLICVVSLFIVPYTGSIISRLGLDKYLILST